MTLPGTLFSVLFRQAAFVSAGTLAARVANALTGIVIARAAGPGPFGTYATVWAVTELCLTLSDLGMVTGIKRQGARAPNLIPSLLGNALLVRLALGAAVPEGVLEEFTKETGIKVEYSTYENNEVMYSKLKLQKGKGYDIVVPSTYLVSLMREEGLLHEIDHSKLSNIGNLSPDLGL